MHLKKKILFIMLFFSTMFCLSSLQGMFDDLDPFTDSEPKQYSFDHFKRGIDLQLFLNDFEKSFDIWKLGGNRFDKSYLKQVRSDLNAFFERHSDYIWEDSGNPALTLLTFLLDKMYFNEKGTKEISGLLDHNDYLCHDDDYDSYNDECYVDEAKEGYFWEAMSPIFELIAEKIGMVINEYNREKTLNLIIENNFFEVTKGQDSSPLKTKLATIFLEHINTPYAKDLLFHGYNYLASQHLKGDDGGAGSRMYFEKAASLGITDDKFFNDAYEFLEVYYANKISSDESSSEL